MKYFSVIAIWVIIFFAGCSKAPSPTEPGNNSTPNSETIGKLIVTAVHENGLEVDSAQVYFNGVFIGLTPLKYKLAGEGISAIRVQKQPYMIFRQSLSIQNAEEIYVEAILNEMPDNTGQLLVSVDRDSCQIQVSDTEGNILHQVIEQEFAAILAAAGYFINVTKEGYAPITRATKVTTDSITIENLHLVPLEQVVTPEIQLQLPDSVEINKPVLIQWEATNATRVDIDYVDNPGISGKREIIFSTPGVRGIKAIAYNQSKSVSVVDSVIIYEKTIQYAPPALEFKVTPKLVNTGEPVHLQWQSDGRYVMIDQGVGMRGREGREEAIFSTPGTKVFTAIAYGNNGITTTVKDSVLVNQADDPLLPAIMVDADDSVAVGQPAVIEWHTSNAMFVDLDYVGQVGLNGKTEVAFDSPGVRIISATAYNPAGQTGAQDTIVVYEPAVTTIDPIYVPCGIAVAAYHESIPRVAEAAALVDIEHAGYYQVTAEVNYNSGDNQKNESCFILIQNPDGTLQTPTDPNAGVYKVVPDDPGPAHLAQREAGIFYFSQGSNIFQLQHYAEIAEQYPQFAVNPPIAGAESLRVVSFSIEFMNNPD